MHVFFSWIDIIPLGFDRVGRDYLSITTYRNHSQILKTVPKHAGSRISSVINLLKPCITRWQELISVFLYPHPSPLHSPRSYYRCHIFAPNVVSLWPAYITKARTKATLKNKSFAPGLINTRVVEASVLDKEYPDIEMMDVEI